MISFESDYTTGAHPAILRRFLETNTEPLSGYGSDPYTASAKEKIKQACACPHAEVYFLTGGTQTNMIVIASLLRSYEGVIAAETGHVSLHEAGAIEHSGHKVLTLPHTEGKIKADALRAFLAAFDADENREHMVQPGMVYISHPTEYGTLYSKEELTALSRICRERGIPLFLDGARLAYGLMSRQTNVTLPDIAELTDVFYIGGTKAGALCGEAVVFTHNNMPPHFLTFVKSKGALLAKGRLTGIQFDTLFTDDLYFKIGAHAIEKAEEMKIIFRNAGCRFYLDSPTNQQFLILENGEMERLSEHVRFSFWEPYDENHTVVRFAASWSTTDEDMAELKRIL